MSEADDREELIALMHASRIAIWTKNYPAWAACFVHEPYMVRWGYLRGGGIFARRGWEDISHRAKAYIEGDMPYDEAYAYQTSIENLILRIHGDMAWAIYDQQHPGHDYPDHVGPGLTREMRVFRTPPRSLAHRSACIPQQRCQPQRNGNVAARQRRQGPVDQRRGRPAAEGRR